MSWAVGRFDGSAEEFHRREIPEPVSRQVWIFAVQRPALVLGSAQPEGHVDREACERFGIDVVRRRSGGGAVLVLPDVSLWIDVLLPVTDALWDDDVSAATRWLGQVWARAVGPGARVHSGRMVRTEWSPYVCFAGLGPGEVTVDGRKAVGISQRRTRTSARFQTIAQSRFEPRLMAALLNVPDRPALTNELIETLAAVEVNGLAERFIAALP